MGTNATDLEPASRRFLKGTVLSWSATIEGVRVAAHHARPENDMHGVMPDATAAELVEVLRAANADILVTGHTHRAMELRLGDRLVLNPGALLRDPSDGWERELPRRERSACWSCPRRCGRSSRRGRGGRSRSRGRGGSDPATSTEALRHDSNRPG